MLQCLNSNHTKYPQMLILISKKCTNPMCLKYSPYLFDDNWVVNWTASKAHITRTKGIKICLKEQKMMPWTAEAYEKLFEINVIPVYTNISVSQITFIYISVEWMLK